MFDGYLGFLHIVVGMVIYGFWCSLVLIVWFMVAFLYVGSDGLTGLVVWVMLLI